ncbi:hypothetical protein OZX56_06450 [Lactobacillus sp. ESL0684]|uniref:hypothetical protein n=1 Tax=unclassified Lactobacillus TaxID=2620435 RepID=UPI0023F9CDE7|nr:MULTISPECIES: hypothetical protein [unclassified Lactobacillus]WEV41258.1 hypothetical protein OZX59_09050 [Lactobacillus sp. ESL0681]WEV44526.1 hypothetical protein OZX56_06450 [Lactobacillus sp. ESL0684]
MYAVLAFTAVMLFLMIGEWVSSITNAYVPSVFITAVLFAVGYWTFLPKDIVAKASFGPDFANICISLLLVHLGTLMNLKQLIQQWKAVCISLLGVAGTILLTLTIGSKIFDWHTVIAAVPPLTGGLVSALLMTNGLKAAGITGLVALPIAMFVMHSVVGYPLTAWMLKREGRRVAGEYQKGNLSVSTSQEEETELTKKSKLPEEYHTASFILVKVGLVALLANAFSAFLLKVLHFDLNANVVCLIFGVIAHQLGFLEDSALNKANVYQWLMYGLLAYIFSQLSVTTPQIIGKVFLQIVVLMFLGILGMFLASAILAKPFKMSPEMAFACSLTALFGFPADYILTTEICHNVAKDKDEEAVLLDQMLPKMLVGGFATVSVASVIIASVFLKLL